MGGKTQRKLEVLKTPSLTRALCILLVGGLSVMTAAEAKNEHGQNRLAKEKSPYLLQHANNPVDWYAWGPEAFEKAKKEDN